MSFSRRYAAGVPADSRTGRTPSRDDSRQPGIRIAPSRARTRQRNLLLDVPIAGRLTLGFLIAALIAALAAGVAGVQRAQELTRESTFYQNLLQTNTSLTTGDSFLQLMDSELHAALALTQTSSPSQEDLATDQKAVQSLETQFSSILDGYSQQDLLTSHPDRAALIEESGHANQISQQRTLTSSALRTWQVYSTAQDEVLRDIAAGNFAEAAALERSQAEPTHADVLSALRSLIQFNGRLASSVQGAAAVEETNQLYITVLAAVLAFLSVGGVGVFISDTIVRRLKHLRRVTQEVEAGQIGARAEVVGKDEIGGVSASVNGMLDTIVGLLQETRRQRDALQNAAERLFSDIRIASAGDLRVNANASSDPIGMLGNAFNFTIGRFRRFMLRAQTATEQLDVLSRQQIERTDAFLLSLQQLVRASSNPSQTSVSSYASSPAYWPSVPGLSFDRAPAEPSRLLGALDSARDQARVLMSEGAAARARVVVDLAEQAYLSAQRVRQLALTTADPLAPAQQQQLTALREQETQHLSGVLVRLANSAQNIDRETIDGLTVLTQSLDRASETARTLPAEGAARAQGSGPIGAPLSQAHAQSFARLGAAYGQEVAALARHMIVIAQEMRAGLAPFQLGQDDGMRSYEPLSAPPYSPFSASQPPYHSR